MHTLAIVNGDLVPGARGFRTVSGLSKAVQDVGIALREPLGHDRFHSDLGTVLPEFIGVSLSADTVVRVKSEVKRVVASYTARQAREQERRVLRGERAALSDDEAVVGVDGIEVFYGGQDRIDVVIKVRTRSGRTITLQAQTEA